MASDSENVTLINKNDQLQSYYYSLESRVGYRLLLGGTRHFGYWDHDTFWPFPLGRSLRAMEDKLAECLNLPNGARVLDAGCGVGHVAIHLAQTYDFDIQGIDVIDHHIVKSRNNIAAHSKKLRPNQVEVRKMDYHHLESLKSDSFEGAYTMETFVHATNPEAVLAGFYRILKPGGRLALFEYDHNNLAGKSNEMGHSMDKINEYAAMPTNALSVPGKFKDMLEQAGFENVVVRDYSDNIRPMTRLFYALAIIPYIIVTFLRLEKYFINTIAGVETYRGYGNWRYVAISATKPGELGVEAPKTR